MESKNPGFSFIEVVIAVIVFSVMITTLFVSQGRMLQRASSTLYQWKALVALKNYWYQAEKKHLNAQVKKQSSQVDGIFEIQYQPFKIAEDSLLRNKKGLRRFFLSARWDSLGFSREVSLGGFSVVFRSSSDKGSA